MSEGIGRGSKVGAGGCFEGPDPGTRKNELFGERSSINVPCPEQSRVFLFLFVFIIFSFTLN